VVTPPKKPKRSLKRWLKSTSNRTFVVYPIVVVALELLIRRGTLAWEPLGVPLLIWGYAQYRLVGSFRLVRGGGGPGLDVPPDRIVDYGPYAYVRNPMYLGHLIFMLGLAITFYSLPAFFLLVFHFVWFDRRVRRDERHLEQRFGVDYVAYKARVKRWVPGVF